MRQAIKKLWMKSNCISITLILLVIGCSEATGPTDNASTERGTIIQNTSLGQLSSNEINQMLAAANAAVPLQLTYNVDVFSMNYYTVDRNGDPVIVSGAILIPVGLNGLPMVSIQHGTQSKSDLVASVSPANSSEGNIGLIMASMGYLVVIPDYLGFGVSSGIHPYFHAESLIPSIIDLMRAARSYCNSNSIILSGDVFLTGYSEGGYASFLTQRKIELEYSQEFNLVAVAPMAGPYDLYGTVSAGLQAVQYNSTPAYPAYLFTAYNEVYGWNRLDEIFNEPYSSRVENLFDGSKTWGEVIDQLPTTIGELFRTDFIESYTAGNETEIITALQENTILDWIPDAPINFIHGDADNAVPIQNAITAMNTMVSNGTGNVQLTIIENGTHESAGPEAAITAIQWFENF